MPQITPPDFLQMARDLSKRTGKPECAMLAVIADTIERKIAATDSEQIKFHLSLDLAKVRAEIGPALERAVKGGPVTPAELRAFRAHLGLTQARLAALLPVPKRTLEEWEAGRRNPPEYLGRALRDVERELISANGSEIGTRSRA